MRLLTYLLVFWALSLLILPASAAGAAEPGLVTARPAQYRVVLSTFTRARASMQVISEVAARCLEVEVDVGQTLGPDGVFARLDDTFVRLELEKTKSEIARLDSRLAFVKRQVGRYQKLVKSKSEAETKLEELELELQQTGHQKQALVTSAGILEERLARHTVRAPAGWRVIERGVEPGQWVGVGSPLAKVGDFRTLLAPVALTPEQFEALNKAPRPLHLTVPQTGGQVEARVERVSPAFDPATRKIQVDLAVSKGLDPMRGGVRLELALDLPDPAGAVLVPRGAVSERYQESWLTRAEGGQIRVVVLGAGPDDTLRVTAPGLKPGQQFRIDQ